MTTLNLTERLTEQTQSLKEQYIEKTAEWAKKEYARYEKMAKWGEVEWCKYFRLEPGLDRQGRALSFPKGFYNTKNAVTYDRLQNVIRNASRIGIEEFIENEKVKAEEHYKKSIEKLAARIAKKNINEDNLSIHTSHIGVNIETTITDGNKKVRAFTVLAYGQIQRPHYRYLIK